MTTTKKFLTQAFAVQTDEAQDVPGLAFTIPAGQPAHLKLQLLYDCPPDVDGVLSLDLNAPDLEYAGFVLDGIHRVNSAPDPQPDNPLAINFEMANVVGLTDIELPGRGIAFRRDLLSVDYFFIGGDNDVKFNVCFRQNAPGTAPSTIRWAKAEFNAG